MFWQTQIHALASLVKAIKNLKCCINFKKYIYQQILPLDFELLYKQNLRPETNQFHFLAWQEWFSVDEKVEEKS